MRISRKFLAAGFKLLAAATIIISFQPCLALFFGRGLDRGPHNYYQHIYWNYFVIRSWLAALAGIAIGLVLLWVGGRIKGQHTASQPKSLFRFSIKRIAAIICLVVGAIVACIYVPGLSSYFGNKALDYQEPMNVSPMSAGMVFTVMSNELTAPQVEFSPSHNGTNLWTNISITMPQK